MAIVAIVLEGLLGLAFLMTGSMTRLGKPF